MTLAIGGSSMTSKLENRTGSPMLGAELKRLRGARTLQEIADLSRSPALAGRVLPLTPSALSQFESGQSPPGVEALHALSIVFKVSPQRFYDLIASERETKHVSLPE